MISFAAVTVAVADPKSDVEDAVRSLNQQPNYSWKTAFKAWEPISSKPGLILPKAEINLSSRSIASGITEKNGFTVITLYAHGRGNSEDATVVLNDTNGRAVGLTPKGWMTEEEIQQKRVKNPSPYDNGPQIAAAFKTRTPTEELTGLLKDVATYSSKGADIVGTLSETATEMRLGSRERAIYSKSPASYPRATALFRIRGGAITAFAIILPRVQEPPSPNIGGRPLPTTSSPRVTEIFEIGTTVVTIPDGALERITK